MSEKPPDIKKLSDDFINTVTNWIGANPKAVFFIAIAFICGIAVGRCR